jgi:hypothetical protein
VQLPRALYVVPPAPAQHASRPNLTHNTLARRFSAPSLFAGKAAAIEERVKGMGADEAQAAREKAAEDARKGGA